MATYGSKFMVALQACEQIMNLRYTLCMMSMLLDGRFWIFGVNASVVTFSNIPQSTLNLSHNAFSYHCVCECIASEVMYLLYVEGKLNLT
jgi:hypothetical protein